MRRRTLPWVLLFALLEASAGRAADVERRARPPAFAVLTDVQYADLPDAGRRSYRSTLARLEACLRNLNDRALAFILSLGDVIQGYPSDPERSEADLCRVLEIFQKARSPVRWVIGNHCLTVPRKVLLERLRLQRAYDEFSDPSIPGWRFVLLDENYGARARIGPDQVAWLQDVLLRAEEKGERVILFGHYPLETVHAQRHQKEAPVPLLELLKPFPAVVAAFAGHDHAGRYVFTNGIHSVTLRGIVEAPSNAWAVIELHEDRIEERGFGEEPSRSLKIWPKDSAHAAPAVRK